MSKWPKKVRHRNKVLAKIYRPCSGRESYRVTWYAAGRRQMKSFPFYSGPGGAKEFSETLVKELAHHSQAVMLTSSQATDALAALERLNTFQQSTGKRVSLLASVSEYCEAAAKLRGRTMVEAVDGFIKTVATVECKDLSTAVEEFLAIEEPRTRAADGQRSQLSAKYHYNRSMYLRRFGSTFCGHAVSDLGKQDLGAFFPRRRWPGFRPRAGTITAPPSRNFCPGVSARITCP
ncbi:MAG: hypothetical protein HY043_07600 [Verrucomicrobia bacterium]|nr:hypothetical protein [Verrucomicrobiota bacterium]